MSRSTRRKKLPPVQINQQAAASPRRFPAARRWCMRAAAVLIGVVLALVVVEVGFRLVGYEPGRVHGRVLLLDKKSQRGFYCYPSNPHREFVPLPDLSQGSWQLEDSTLIPQPRHLPLEQLERTPWCVEMKLSTLGIRDKEISYRVPTGTCRIACMGDSFVMGEGVALAGTLPRQLQARLGNGYEVVNLGASGLNTRQEVERLGRFRSELEIDRVLFVFIPNDIEYNQQLAARQAYINDLINVREAHLDQFHRRAWYGGSSRLLALAGAPLAMRRITNDTIQWYRDLYDPAQNAEGLQRLSQDFTQLAHLHNCRVVLVLYPLIEGFEKQYPLAAVHERVANMAREAGLPVCDLAPAFAGQSTTDLQVHPVDHHPNSKSHGIAADAILRWLNKHDPEFLRLADAPDKQK